MGTPPNGRNRLAANGQVWSASFFTLLPPPRAILARVGLQAATLLLSVALRWTALASAATLVVFAASMFFCSGFEAPRNASVFSAAAAALLLALCPPGSDVVSIDHLRRSRRPEQKAVK